MRTAAATAVRYPMLELDTPFCGRMIKRNWHQRRWGARHIARRLYGDLDGVDLCWLMLAACPEQPWTFGFVGRLSAMMVDWQDSARNAKAVPGVDRGWPEKKVVERMERWESLRQGVYAKGNDPFAETRDERWNDVEEIRKRMRERAERVAAEAIEFAEKARKNLGGFIADGEETPPEPFSDDHADPGEMLVIASDGKLLEPYKRLQQPVGLTMTPPVWAVTDDLIAEFPHAAAAIETMLVDLREDEPVRFRPFILVGEPGCGKSRLVRRLAEHLGARLRRYDGAGSGDNSFGGTPKQWSTASACFPLIAVAHYAVGNPIVMIDEIDKAATGYHHGNLAQALMPFLERETAQAYPDVGLQIECDLSAVNYALTANDETKLPSPLRDRCRIIRVPSPTVEHLPHLTASIMRDIAADRNLEPAWLPPLAPDELAVIAKAWSGSDRSVRKLQKIVSATVTARENNAVRH